MQKRDNSPQPIREKVMQEESPSTSKMFHSPRPSPQSAHQTVSPQAMAGRVIKHNSMSVDYFCGTGPAES
jgi:hypothetical protein